MNLGRKSGTKHARTIYFLDPRVWRTLYGLRLLFADERGWLPSRDYVLSELLVDPERGAEILREVAKRYAKIPVPAKYGPRGNRHQQSLDANADYQPGPDGPEGDWGLESHRSDRSVDNHSSAASRDPSRASLGSRDGRGPS